MGRKSTIEQLPADLLEKLQELLRDPRVTIEQVAEQINQQIAESGDDVDPVSKSAVGRYSLRMDQIGKRLKESRAMAEMWIGKLGSQPQGEVGKLLNEIIRTLAFETTLSMTEGDEPVSPKMLSQLALAVQRLEASATDNIKRDEMIRKQARAKAAEEAAEVASEVGKANGLSSEKVTELRNKILGVAN